MSKMSTALAEQLRRLKTPQTSFLIDSKKRESILFDPKEAATKDRETIFDIGYSGLQDLVALNPSFLQFESTLFDKNAQEMQRAVETREVNKHLNEVIKKFLIHLSPYLLLQPSHKCLEWLIRRFNINKYNKDELMMLIFPYHETKIFVKCIQTMHLSDPDDKWHWLHKIQGPGVPLSKQALLNRAASDSFFMSFVCESIVYAVDELKIKSNTLQVYYAFYCTTVIGALEVAKINESHITNIYKSIRMGLKSNSIDFCAASLMIIGQLVSKTKLTQNFLDSLVAKLLKVSHAKLQPDAIILLVLIYRNQSEMIHEIPAKCLPDLVHSKWIASVLAHIYGEGINILPFYLPLLSACLKIVQLKGDNWKVSRKFCDILLSECLFNTKDAEAVIRCTLDSFIVSEKLEESVINIESDNEDDNMGAANKSKQVISWYTNTLKLLERKYSNTFDAIVKEIIRSDDKSMSKLKKKSLKTVLGFLFTIVCADDNVNLFEKLYHYNAQYRIEAVNYLVTNLEKMSFSDDSKGLLKNSIAERISDESPLVVHEALKFETTTLIKIVGRRPLQKKLIAILEQTLQLPSIWDITGLAALKHLTSPKLCKDIVIDILIAVLPFLLQSSGLSVDFVRQILNSAIADYVKFVDVCKQAVAGMEDADEIFKRISVEFESKKGLPQTADILKYVKSIGDNELTVSKAFYSMLLLGYSVDKTCKPDVSLQILSAMARYESLLKTDFVSDSSKWMVNVAMGVYPLNLNVACILNIMEVTNFNELNKKSIDFNKPSATLLLLHKIFERFISGMARNHSNKTKYDLYVDGLQLLFRKILTKHEKRLEFLSNYFIVELLESDSTNNICLDNKLQVFTIKHFNTMLEEDVAFASAIFEISSFIRILSGLRSMNAKVREASFGTLAACKNLQTSKYTTLIGKLLKRKSEILMDENQLPLILFTIFQKPSSKDLNTLLMEFIDFIAVSKDNDLLVSLMLEALTHVNTENILKSTAKTALTILLRASQTINASDSKTIILDSFKSTIIQNILLRYTHQTIKIVKKDETVWLTLFKAVEEYGVLLKLKSKQVSVTSVAVALFDNELFNELTTQQQRQIIRAVVNSATYAGNSELTTPIGKFIKQIKINAKICSDLLDEMASNDRVEAMEVDEPSTSTRQRQPPSTSAAEFTSRSGGNFKSKSWKCGITWLEFLQNKQEITNAHLLIPSLFAVLQKCLLFEDQSGVEYVKQLVLSCIHHLCVIIAPDGNVNGNLISDKVFKIEPVVQCIRGTQNPQTHHHALQLLSHSARMLPDQVLHNMMDIFTFMGSSVVRHDDAYSFQIITNIISSIIPTLTKANENKSKSEQNALVLPVLKVFSDIILDVPEHRRLLLYVKLLDTLNTNDYLWMFLITLIESHVLHSTMESDKSIRRQLTASNVKLPQRIEIALALTKEFSCESIIITATKLIEFLQKMPTNKPVNEAEKVSNDVLALFNVNSCTKRQFRHFKYEIVKFINNLTSSVEFVNKVAKLTEDETQLLKSQYQEAIIHILTFIPDVSKATEQSTETAHVDYWKAMLHNCFDILENVISLLSSNLLLVVVEGLLSHKLPSVRRRVIELLINKLQFNTELFTETNEANLVALLDPLTKIIESVIDEKKLFPMASSIENVGIQQMSLMAIKLLSKQLAEKYHKQFKGIVETLIQILRKSENVPRILLATVVLCLAEICANLRVHAIAYLPNFMKIFLEVLKIQVSSPNVNNDNVLVCLITGLQKVVGTLPLYLSPYLVKLIVRLSQIWHNVENEPGKDPKRTATLIERLNGIWEKLSSTLELRVLIPTIDQSYKQLVAEEQSIGIGPLMQLLSQVFQQQSASNISSFMSDITSFFIFALQFRADHKLTADLAVVNSTEDKIIQSFVALILKLSEGSFRPLYYRINDWALKSNEIDHDRAITFFRLSSEIAKSLKSLFVLFASDFMQDAADLLNKCAVSEIPTDPNQLPKTALLIESIVKTLYQVFLHDSRGFVNSTRFETLLQPLVDQIENEIVLNSAPIKDLVSSCLAQLGTAVNDDIQWKQLNYQILMKTRNNNSDIRLFALKVCVELATKLGEDYMPLLPETVPFLSEMLEDENIDVEKQCQRSVQELEKILGEPLQKYF